MTDPSRSVAKGADRLDASVAHRIPDTASEPGFDDVAAVARALRGASAGFVSLVAADRRWFKARSGFEPCRTPVGQAICTRAPPATVLLVVPNLTRDARTADNAMVTALRTCASRLSPPWIAAGQVIGRVGVLDGRVRRGAGVRRDLGRALAASMPREMVRVEPDRRAPGIAGIAGPYHLRDRGRCIDDPMVGDTIIGAVASGPRTGPPGRAAARRGSAGTGGTRNIEMRYGPSGPVAVIIAALAVVAEGQPGLRPRSWLLQLNRLPRSSSWSRTSPCSGCTRST